MSDVLLVETLQLGSFPVEVWTVNRPDKLNALNGDVLRRLDEEGARLEAELKKKITAKRALILRGAGEKAFVAGADIAEMQGFGRKEAEQFSRLGQRAFGRLELLPIPTLAAIQGFALGGGLELAMGCDMLVASSDAQVGQPEVFLGLIPGFGATARLAERVGLNKALELLYTGRRIPAAEALALGILQKVGAPGEKAFDLACKLAEECLAKSGPLALAEVKRVTRSVRDEAIHRTCELEAEAFGKVFESEDKREGVAAFLEKRKAVFRS
jgi:enoyl-CoA hydratase